MRTVSNCLIVICIGTQDACIGSISSATSCLFPFQPSDETPPPPPRPHIPSMRKLSEYACVPVPVSLSVSLSLSLSLCLCLCLRLCLCLCLCAQLSEVRIMDELHAINAQLRSFAYTTQTANGEEAREARNQTHPQSNAPQPGEHSRQHAADASQQVVEALRPLVASMADMRAEEREEDKEESAQHAAQIAEALRQHSAQVAVAIESALRARATHTHIHTQPALSPTRPGRQALQGLRRQERQMPPMRLGP